MFLRDHKYKYMACCIQRLTYCIGPGSYAIYPLQDPIVKTQPGYGDNLQLTIHKTDRMVVLFVCLKNYVNLRT